MDEVTQQNSALVEENAATAKTLENQSGAMGERIEFFELEHAERRAPATSCRRMMAALGTATGPGVSRGPRWMPSGLCAGAGATLADRLHHVEPATRGATGSVADGSEDLAGKFAAERDAPRQRRVRHGGGLSARGAAGRRT